MNPNNTQPEAEVPSIDQEILKRKVADFEKKLVALQAEHGLVIVPIINSTMHGIMPDLIYMTKDEFERRMKAGQAASGLQTNGVKS